jgi:tetratricopeptide (TPR) repeat protein/O-antigen ligase
MKSQLAATLDTVMTVLLLAVAALTPLLFFNQTTEFFEMPKLVFLVVTTILLTGLWIFSWIVRGKVAITRTPLDIPLLILLIVVLVSMYFSDSRYAAIFGNFPRVHGSAVAWVTYILLYFVTVSHLNSVTKVKSFLYTLYASGIVVAVISLLSFFGLYLPFDFARAANFSPTGSSFSTIAFLLLLLPLPILSIINPNKYFPLPFALASVILFGLTIALIGALPTYVALLLAFALCFFVSKPQQIRKTLPMFLVPVIVLGLAVALAYLPFPGNPVQAMRANFPQEIQLPFPISWKVSASAFRDAPFIGTGPSSYLYNFTSYKPAEFNQLTFWNFSFDTAYNEFLQTLGTLGVLGLVGLVLFCLAVVNISRKNIAIHSSDESHESTPVLLPALALSGLLTIVLLAIHATTLVSVVVTLFMLAALMASQKSIRERVTELSVGFKATTAGNRQLDLLPIFIFILFVIAMVPVLYRTYNVVMADYYHRQALAQASQSGQLTYQNLQRAETLNPYIDLYRVDLAQTNFALANAIASSKLQNVPEGASPAAALTDQDRQTIQTLLSQSINEGRISVALAPRSARNWEVLASIYRNISGVSQNALAFSLDAYGRAIQRDPLNPALRVNVGGIYYAIKNYDLAIRFFTDAANLKPDYANAYYNLAIALRDKGDLRNAQLVAEQTVALLRTNMNSQDYKTATELLQDIKTQAPAAQTDSALGNENVDGVDVADLETPPTEVATPSAVQRNPNARLPQLTPTPAARTTPAANR